MEFCEIVNPVLKAVNPDYLWLIGHGIKRKIEKTL
jgi:hypothetical protein